MDATRPRETLRRGWTTGACATAAAKAAYAGLVTGAFPDPVEIPLPSGARPAFALARSGFVDGGAFAGVVKDAGDDPDVTHGVLVLATLRRGPPGSGIAFRAGPGVGTVTRAGLPLPVGEPAISTTTSGGEVLAQKTLNPRLGILGGLSVLGTTGVVVPYSCAAWIDSIHRGIDVARAGALDHVAGATGSTSEEAVARLHGLPPQALIDMGDFAGGMLKYLRRHPVPRVTVAGGIAKMAKLGHGLLDLHSRSGPVDLAWLAERIVEAGGEPDLGLRAVGANTALEVLRLAQARDLPLADLIARYAWATAARALAGSGSSLEVVVFDREGRLVGRAPFHPVG